MKKKTYQTPEMKIVSVGTIYMLASSGRSVSSETVDPDTQESRGIWGWMDE